MWSRLREIAYLLVPAMGVVVAVLALASLFVQPAPPSSLVIATGGTSGAYYSFGKQYAELLAKSGVTLEVRSTAGSVENVKLLSDASSGVSVALVQGGIANASDLPGAVSLGRVTLEPLWVFYRANKYYDRLVQLRGKRLAVGKEGSGTRRLAETLLEANGAMEGTTLLPLGGEDATAALANDEVDAVFLVMAPTAKLIERVAA